MDEMAVTKSNPVGTDGRPWGQCGNIIGVNVCFGGGGVGHSVSDTGQSHGRAKISCRFIHTV